MHNMNEKLKFLETAFLPITTNVHLWFLCYYTNYLKEVAIGTKQHGKTIIIYFHIIIQKSHFSEPATLMPDIPITYFHGTQTYSLTICTCIYFFFSHSSR